MKSLISLVSLLALSSAGHAALIATYGFAGGISDRSATIEAPFVGIVSATDVALNSLSEQSELDNIRLRNAPGSVSFTLSADNATDLINLTDFAFGMDFVFGTRADASYTVTVTNDTTTLFEQYTETNEEADFSESINLGLGQSFTFDIAITSGYGAARLDDVRLSGDVVTTVIPEPSTFALVGLMIPALFWIARRRR
jgi:hypothetical protein